MRHVLVTLTCLALALNLIVTLAFADTRESLEAEARKYGAPMVRVSDGVFRMGSLTGPAKSQPLHVVSLATFYIDQYEVTTARYAQFLAAAGQDDPELVPMLWDQVNVSDDGDRPVMGVTWVAADAYCRSVGKRLATEAEWEKAARGADGRTYPWGDNAPTVKLANFDQPVSATVYRDSLRPVGSYEAGKSAYGAYDMAGSVSEWVSDWYHEAYYATSPVRDPQGPTHGQQKVLRGGSFGDPVLALKSTSRESYFPVDQGPYAGIRCAQTAFGRPAF